MWKIKIDQSVQMRTRIWAFALGTCKFILGKSGTIGESTQALDVYKAYYA